MLPKLEFIFLEWRKVPIPDLTPPRLRLPRRGVSVWAKFDTQERPEHPLLSSPSLPRRTRYLIKVCARGVLDTKCIKSHVHLNFGGNDRGTSVIMDIFMKISQFQKIFKPSYAAVKLFQINSIIHHHGISWLSHNNIKSYYDQNTFCISYLWDKILAYVSE